MDSDRIYQDELRRFGGPRRPPAGRWCSEARALALKFGGCFVWRPCRTPRGSRYLELFEVYVGAGGPVT